MKAKLGDPDHSSPWDFEVKWDGYRAIAFCESTLRLQGRRLDDITAAYPELARLSDETAARGKVFDGELVVLDSEGRSDFQQMQVRRERGLEVNFMIFDLLWSDGQDLRSRSYSERRKRLESLDLAGDRWAVPARIDGELSEVLAATDRLGLEGIVAKRPDSPYVSGSRTSYWMKVKNERRQELLVGGWLPGKGHRARTLGSLLLGYREPGVRGLRFAGRVGTGMDDRVLSTLRDELGASVAATPPFTGADLVAIPRDAVWCEPRMVVEVKFTKWTRDGRLRNPVFVGFRPDKDPDEVVREER